MSVLMILGVLAAAWWLSLRALDWATGERPLGPAAGDVAALVARWHGADIPIDTRQALRTADIAALDICYERLKVDSWRSNARQGSQVLEEALVSLALAETSCDLAKAYRGLEALQRLRCEMAEAGPGRDEALLDLMEARLRFVLAEVGRDPRQQSLASAALERAVAAGAR
jgi:hypothetical protein